MTPSAKNNFGRADLEFVYTYDGTMCAFEDSLQRLALERMDNA